MKRHFKTFAFTLFTVCSVGCSASLENITSVACQSNANSLIGHLIQAREAERSLENGRDSFGASPSLSRLMNGYKEIQDCMSNEQKTDFFWTMLWHSDFDGEMKYYLEFVTKEVGVTFLDKAKNYRDALEKYKRSKGRLHKISAVINDLEMLNG